MELRQLQYPVAVAEEVLISDNVNIWREIERCGAGLVEGNSAAGATSLLDR